MSIESLTYIPVEFTQGDTISWTYYDSKYTSTDYSFKTVFYSSRGNLTINGVTNGSGWLSSIDHATSSTLYPGLYGYQTYLTSATEQLCIETGTIEVKADTSHSQLPNIDARSSSRKMYEDLSTLLTTTSFVKSLDPDQIVALAELRKSLEWDVKREQDAQKLKRGENNPNRNIYVRFSRPA